MKTKMLVVCVCFLALAASRGAYAQGLGASGDIKGVVTDVTGAVLPKVHVTAVNVEKGLERSVTTVENGEYRVSGLLPATYDVTAKLAGFQTLVRKGVVVTVGQIVTVDMQLQVATLASEIVVTTDTPVVETEKTHQANTIAEQYIRQLPIDRRDYLTYSLLLPGVADSDALADNSDFRVSQTPQSGISFYGSNGRGNNVTVDGAEANDSAGGVRLTLSQEAVQEFQINRSNYSAELGGASGGVINIVSKSGTNEVRGSAYSFFRHDVLDARDPFAIGSALAPGGPFSLTARGAQLDPPSNRQQFGGTLGFPVRKDKSFLLFSYEGLRRDESSAVPVLTDTSIFLPTAAQEAIMATFPPAMEAAFRAVLSIDPRTVESGFQGISEPFLVNLFTNNSGVFPFEGRTDLVSARFDHQVNSSNQFFVRFNFGDARENNRNLRALVGFSRGTLIETRDNSVVGGWYRQFGPAKQNELRAQWNRYTFDVTTNDRGGPELNLPGFGFFNRDIFLPSFNSDRRYEFADNFTWTTGRHRIKFGGSALLRDVDFESHTFMPGRFNFGPLPGALVDPAFATTTITALQAFKLGLPQIYQQGFGDPTVGGLSTFGALFVQDSWSPWPRLTLNFGLRYELDERRPPLRTDKNNFAPRFGFSWDPFQNHKTVVRGGYGIFYSPTYYQIDYVVQALGQVNGFRQIVQVLVPFAAGPAFGADEIFQSLLTQGVIGCGRPSGEACITPAILTASFPMVFPPSRFSQTGPIPPLTVLFSGADDYVSAYSQQASLGIERELLRNFAISADFIFSRALKISRARDKNLLEPPIGPLGIRQWNIAPCTTMPASCFINPLILQDIQYESTGRSFYHGFLLSATKRFSHHFSVLANYTFSKAIDEVTDYNSDFRPFDQRNLRAERALSPFDQRHKVVVAAVLESPWKGGAGAHPAERIFSGFVLSPVLRGNSGRPFNLLVGADINGDRVSSTDRPASPAAVAGRNTGRGPDFWTFDLRLTRKIAFGERRSAEMIFEAFNLFNRLNFASVNNTVGNVPPPFNLTGRRERSPSQPLGFTSVFPRRNIQLGVRLNF